MRRLVRPFIVLAALVILLETWIWERVGPVIARLVEVLPLKALKQAVHDGIQRLPPYATLAVFAIPAMLLFPFKLAALALIARGHVILGGGVFFLAKVVGVGCAAFLFDACKPKLMQIPLFVWAYEHWLKWLAWAHTHIDPIKARIRRFGRILTGGRSSRALKLLVRFRRTRRERMRQAQPYRARPERQAKACWPSCPALSGHPRLSSAAVFKSWMAGTSPAMTKRVRVRTTVARKKPYALGCALS